MTSTRVATPNPLGTRVRSDEVTAAQLAEWGFPVEVRGHCVGVAHVLVEGTSFGEALHAAWAAGFVEQRSADPAELAVVREAERACREAVAERERAESFAWARANLGR